MSIGLLLCWYIRAKRSNLLPIEPNPTVDAIIDESITELEYLQIPGGTQLEETPLAAGAELLKDDSVWQCESYALPEVAIMY